MTGGIPGTGRRPDGAAFVIALILAAIGALLIWDGGRIPNKANYAGVGPGDVPKMVGAGLLLLAAATGFSGLRGGTPRERQAPVPVLWIVGGLAAQLALLQFAGFSIASGVLFACTAAAFGKRNFALTLPVGIVFAFVVYGLFDRLLQLNLPAGPLETLIWGG